MTGDAADQTEELSEYKKKYFTSRGLNPKNLDLLPKTKDVFDGLSDDVVKKLDELGTALEDDLKHGGGVPPEGEMVAYAEEAEGAGYAETEVAAEYVQVDADADADPTTKLKSYVFMIH
jgi:hypothetical protein